MSQQFGVPAGHGGPLTKDWILHGVGWHFVATHDISVFKMMH